jgi:MFS family permease
VPVDGPKVTAAPVRRAVVYGMFPVIALAATTALETGERQSLAQAVQGIQDAFHVSDKWIGFLPAGMTVIGVIGSFPFGHLADRVRRTWMLAGAMAVWTVCMGFNALVATYALLVVARLGVGIVEANGPAAVSLMSDYYPVRDRAKMMGLYNSGGLVGATIGLGVGGVMVDAFGWRAAFWMWIPFGILTVFLLLRAPEPRRGDQDVDFHHELADHIESMEEVDAVGLAPQLELPPPSRVGDLDYATAGWREAFHEVLKIRSMWFGVFGLSASQAGGFAVLFGIGAAVGVVAGGFVSDRLLRRGIVNARVYVVAFSSMIATALFFPAFVSTTFAITLPLFLVGGLFLTLPLAPADAMLSDVVVAPLRGRAASMRSVVRSLSGLAPLIIGWLSSLTDLRTALIIFTPLYAVGGFVMLAAARTYPADLAFVVAESRRINLTSTAASWEDARDD